MKLARVIGTVVASTKAQGMEGVKLLVVRPLDRNGEPIGPAAVAADATRQAGPGHLVFVVGSREAAQAMTETFVPVDLAITGIVDRVDRVTDLRGPTAAWQGPAPGPGET